MAVTWQYKPSVTTIRPSICTISEYIHCQDTEFMWANLNITVARWMTDQSSRGKRFPSIECLVYLKFTATCSNIWFIYTYPYMFYMTYPRFGQLLFNVYHKQRLTQANRFGRQWKWCNDSMVTESGQHIIAQLDGKSVRKAIDNHNNNHSPATFASDMYEIERNKFASTLTSTTKLFLMMMTAEPER